jgi:hypothetical protein
MEPAYHGAEPMKQMYTVYLAGPITGCNEDQRRTWRQRVKENWGKDFNFIDPTDPMLHAKEGGSKFEIVSRDELCSPGALESLSS